MIQNTIPFQPSRFASLRATTPVPVSWETIVNELTGPFHKAQTELYRQTIARLHQAEQENDVAAFSIRTNTRIPTPEIVVWARKV